MTAATRVPAPVLGERWYLPRSGVHVELAETRHVAGHLEVRATPVGKKPRWTDWIPWVSFQHRINDGTYLPSGNGSSAGHGRSPAAGPEGVPSAGSRRGQRSTGSPGDLTKEVTMTSTATATEEKVEVNPDPKPSGSKAKTSPAKAATTPKAETSAAPTVDVDGLQKDLVAAVKAKVSGLKTTKKSSYIRLNGKDTKAIGYITPSKKGLRVEIPNGKGGYDVVKVTEASEISKAAEPMIALASSKKDA